MLILTLDRYRYNFLVSQVWHSWLDTTNFKVSRKKFPFSFFFSPEKDHITSLMLCEVLNKLLTVLSPAKQLPISYEHTKSDSTSTECTFGLTIPYQDWPIVWFSVSWDILESPVGLVTGLSSEAESVLRVEILHPAFFPVNPKVGQDVGLYPRLITFQPLDGLDIRQNCRPFYCRQSCNKVTDPVLAKEAAIFGELLEVLVTGHKVLQTEALKIKVFWINSAKAKMNW